MSRWFEPLIGYHINLVGVDRWIDASSVMINAIAQDDNLLKRDQAISDVSHLLHDVHG